MEVEEIQLLEQVKNFASYSDLAKFFNRSETSIRNNVYRLHHKRPKYVYYKSKINQNNQPFNGKLTK